MIKILVISFLILIILVSIVTLYVKHTHYKPIRRIDILNCALKNSQDGIYGGLCGLLNRTLSDHELWNLDPRTAFPLFTYKNASKEQFEEAFIENKERGYWWVNDDWDKNHGRYKFLLWLIEQYKDDRTDLRKLNNKL